jgi:hypothetical protein
MMAGPISACSLTDMFSNGLAQPPSQSLSISSRHAAALGRYLLVGMVASLTLLGVGSIGVAHASESYVYSIGVLVKIDQRTITLGFEGGDTETYKIGPSTTFRSQDGDERKLEDLAISEPVLIITADGDPTAVTIVDGGPAGFHEAGPADIRGHENGCVCGDKPAEGPSQ